VLSMQRVECLREQQVGVDVVPQCNQQAQRVATMLGGNDGGPVLGHCLCEWDANFGVFMPDSKDRNIAASAALLLRRTNLIALPDCARDRTRTSLSQQQPQDKNAAALNTAELCVFNMLRLWRSAPT
jgi:hypothetical protein